MWQGLHPGALGLQRDLHGPASDGPLEDRLGGNLLRTVTKSGEQTGGLLCFQALDPYSLYLWAPSCSVSALTPAMQQGSQVLVGQVLPGCCRGTETGHLGQPTAPSLENPCPCLEFPKWLHQGNEDDCPHSPCLPVGS